MAAPTMRAYAATAAKAGTAGVSPQTYDVTLPAYLAGDLCVIQLLINAGDLGQADTPAGWTLTPGWTFAGSGTPVQTATFVRIMDGSEGASVHFNKTTFNGYNWKGVASSWQSVKSSAPVASSSSGTSGAAVQAANWTLGTLTGAFAIGPAYWGGQYLKVNSDDGVSFTELGTLTVQLIAGPTDDITTTFPVDYDVLDNSGLLVGTSAFRFALVLHATNNTPPAGPTVVPLKIGLPPFLDLNAGYVLEFDAIDATTGAHVAGVTVANASLLIAALGASAGADAGSLQVGPWLLVPGQS